MDTSVHTNLLECYTSLFQYYRELGNKAMAQVDDAGFSRQPTPESNSISVIVSHLSGNMLSRFSDFLNSDGEKTWRDRDAEFEERIVDRATLLSAWNRGWDCLFEALHSLQAIDLEKMVFIRNQGHTVLEALSRQLGHYAYHVGQIVYVSRMLTGAEWTSLSIPKNGSQAFNTEKFARDKERKFFTDQP